MAQPSPSAFEGDHSPDTNLHQQTIDAPIAAMQRLDRFARYAPDWDNAGAAAIADDTIVRAKRLVRDIFASYSHGEGEPYYIGPIPNGGIQVEWRGNTNSIEVEIRPDGRFNCLLVSGYANQPDITSRRDVSAAEVVRLVSETLDA